MSAEDRVAEVLAEHAVEYVAMWIFPDDETVDDHAAICLCGGEFPESKHPAHQAAMLAAAGLLAPPPPRTFRASDPELDDVRCVVDASGDLWLRTDRYGSVGWTHQDDTDAPYSTRSLLDLHGPVTEVPTGGPS